MDYFHYLDDVSGCNLFQHGNPIRREGYFTDLVTDDAIQFIEYQDHATPFFLYVPYTAPHSPFQGPEDDQTDPLPLDSPLWNQGIAPPQTYIAMIERMDECIGKILDTLEERGLVDDTVVIFASDNGGTGSARNAPLSGIKGSTTEGGIRVPAMVRWPGKIPAATVSDQPCLTFDFTASIANLANVTPSNDKPFEGIDIVNHVQSQRPDIERTLYWRKQRGNTVWKAVRQGSLKYVAKEVDFVEEHLYNLAVDIGEKRDLKQQQTGDFHRLRTLYLDWEKEVRKNRRGQD